MRTSRAWHRILMIASAAAVWLAHHVPASAQCAMCKATAAAQAPGATRALNTGILILLVPPLAIFTGFFLWAVRHWGVEHPAQPWSPRAWTWVRSLASSLTRYLHAQRWLPVSER